MLIEKLQKQLIKSNRNYPQHSNRMSGIGFPCLRNCVMQITHWSEKEKPSPELLAIFNEGRHQERSLKRDMDAAGIDIVRSEESLWLEKERLSGHIDCMYMYRGHYIVVELKSINDNLLKQIDSPYDLINSNKVWHQLYIPQLQLYMYATGVKRGLLILKGKSSGQLKEFIIKRDKKFCRFYLEKCEKVNKHVADIQALLKEKYEIEDIADLDKKEDREDLCEIKEQIYKDIDLLLPERISTLPVCEFCNFQHICLPDEIREEQAILYTESPEFIEQLERWCDIVEIHREYNRIDKKIKKYLKERYQSHFFIDDNDNGMFEITCGKQVQIERHNGGNDVTDNSQGS